MRIAYVTTLLVLVLAMAPQVSAQTEVLVAQCFTVNFPSGNNNQMQNGPVLSNLNLFNAGAITPATSISCSPNTALRTEMKLKVYSSDEIDTKLSNLKTDIDNFSSRAVTAITNKVTANAIKADLAAAAVAAVRQEIANDLTATLIPKLLAQLLPSIKKELSTELRAVIAAEVEAQVKAAK